jgi:hypothetical protein
MRMPWLLAVMAALVAASTGVVSVPRLRGAVVYERAFANCVRDLNCGNCLLGRMDDAACSSGKACIAFKGTATGASFTACTPSTDGNDTCEVDNSLNPNIYCQGFYKKCGCFDGTTNTCPHALCDCIWNNGIPDGAMQFHVNATCL